ncbi:MAG: helix-turn-helix domain-containing protein [Clostridia bacterium]|nr:helix-turn-helix domain-containing protein [Clostridia bacterium]
MLVLSDFAERLNDLMIEKENISTNELAEIIGVHRTTIARYLTGNKIPSVSSVIKLADYFNCTADYLLALQDINQDRTFKQCPPFDEQLKILLEHFQTNRYKIYSTSEINASLLDKWYHGQFQPSIDNVIRLAKFFDCSVDYVLGRVEFE